MPATIPVRAAERLLPLLVGATILAFAAGSSSVPSALRVGHPLRWGMLAALFAAAALTAPRAAVSRSALAAAGAFVGLAELSTAWSIAPRTTFERGASVALLFATCLLLQARCRAVRGEAERLFWGVLLGAAAVAVAGLLELAVAYHTAVEPASYEAPARYRGFGQDPNTAALLFGVTAPLALWAVVSRRRPWTGAAIFALLVGSIVASGSRGGLGSAAVGCVVVVSIALSGRRALLAAIAVLAIAAVGAAVQSLPSPAPSSRSAAPAAAPGPVPAPGYRDANADYPLDADIGRPLPGGGEPPVRRTFLGGSGRGAAWGGAASEAARRPVAGHGFGTEQLTFVDRYYSFVGSLPENSYLGLALQLGAAGLVALAALVAVLARAGVRARAVHPGAAAAGLGVMAAGLVAAVAQSYLYSVGNIAALAFWLPAFLLAGLVGDG